MKRGRAYERDDGMWVVELVCTREEVIRATATPIGQPFAPDGHQPPVARTVIQGQGVEPGAVHGGSAINPVQERRVAMLQAAVCNPRVQAHIRRLSGLEGLPDDAVQHASEWLLTRHRARNVLDLVTDAVWPSVESILSEGTSA